MRPAEPSLPWHTSRVLLRVLAQSPTPPPCHSRHEHFDELHPANVRWSKFASGYPKSAINCTDWMDSFPCLVSGDQLAGGAGHSRGRPITATVSAVIVVMTAADWQTRQFQTFGALTFDEPPVKQLAALELHLGDCLADVHPAKSVASTKLDEDSLHPILVNARRA